MIVRLRDPCIISKNDIRSLARLNKGWKGLTNMDFSPLRLPRPNYATQVELDPNRLDMASFCLMHYGGDTSSLIRFCNGEYIAAWRDTTSILKEIRPFVSTNDFNDAERILNNGCPAVFNKCFTKQNK